MQIKKVKTWTEQIALTRPYTIAFKTIAHVENIFVRIEGENGLYGLGVASPGGAVTGESFEDSRNTLENNLESLLLNKDIRQIFTLCRETKNLIGSRPAACAAIDMSLYDLFTKYINIPLADFLGKVYHSIPTSITIGIKSLEDSLEEAEEYIGRGFRILKLKIGKSLESDIEILSKMRKKVGEEIKIRVDANQGYSINDLQEFLKKTEKLNIEFIEQPLAKDKILEMRNLPEDIRKIIAADECLHDETEAFNLAQYPHPFGIYNIKLMKSGGISSALKIAGIANYSGISLMWGCNDESRVSISAALHAALASPATKYLDLDGSFDLSRDPVEGGFILKNGNLSITENPGLGVILK